MKGHKLLFCAIGAFVALFAAVTAIIIFKNEIVDFFVEIKDRFDEKRFRRSEEFADYADM